MIQRVRRACLRLADCQLEAIGGSWRTAFGTLERELRERTLEQLGAQLGDAAVTAAYEEARTLSFDEAVTYALNEQRSEVSKESAAGQ